jgi:hypothetical protein
MPGFAPASASRVNSVPHGVQLAYAMGVAIDDQHYSKPDGLANMNIFQIKALRLGVDLQGRPVLGGSSKYFFYVDGHGRPVAE